MFVQNIAESLGALLKVYASAVLPLFERHVLHSFQAMLQPSAVATDRVAALCIFDDILEHCAGDGGAIKYVHNAGSILLQLVEAPEAFSDENASASDNAVSALGKLCRRSDSIGAAALPRWLTQLPLRADCEEARAVHRMLVELCEATNTHLLGPSDERLPEIVVVFGKVLGTDLVDEETGARIANLLKQIRNGLPHVLQALPAHPSFASLSPEQRAALEQAISS